MSEWKEVKIKEIGKVITGKTPSINNPEDWGDEMLFITPSDYKNYRNKAYSSIRKLSKSGAERQKNRILPPKSVLVTCIGSDMGKTVINAFPCVTNQQINAIIPNEAVINSDYLYYSTVDLYESLRIAGSDGTAVPILNKTDFENIKILLPPLPEQKAIAEVLSSLDDKIDLLHKQNKTLEQLAETLFRHHFIDNAQDDWEEGKLGDLTSISSGKGLGRDSFVENGLYPVLGANGMIGKTNEFLIDERLIYTGRVGTLGNVFISNGKVWLSDNTLILRPNDHKYFFFVYFFLKSQNLLNHNVGSTQPLIRQSDIKNLELIIPSDSKIRECNEVFESSFIKIAVNIDQIRNLEKLRDQLLPKLMSGEIGVKYSL